MDFLADLTIWIITLGVSVHRSQTSGFPYRRALDETLQHLHPLKLVNFLKRNIMVSKFMTLKSEERVNNAWVSGTQTASLRKFGMISPAPFTRQATAWYTDRPLCI